MFMPLGPSLYHWWSHVTLSFSGHFLSPGYICRSPWLNWFMDSTLVSSFLEKTTLVTPNAHGLWLLSTWWLLPWRWYPHWLNLHIHECRRSHLVRHCCVLPPFGPSTQKRGFYRQWHSSPCTISPRMRWSISKESAPLTQRCQCRWCHFSCIFTLPTLMSSSRNFWSIPMGSLTMRKATLQISQTLVIDAHLKLWTKCYFYMAVRHQTSSLRLQKPAASTHCRTFLALRLHPWPPPASSQWPLVRILFSTSSTSFPLSHAWILIVLFQLTVFITTLRWLDPPVYAHPCKLSPDKLYATRQEFQSMIEMGTALCLASPWSSPLHLVPKTSGEWCPYGNYCHLNISTIPDRCPVPHIQDFSLALSGDKKIEKKFSKIDLIRGYHHIPVHPNDVPRMSISTPFGLF